MEAIVLRKSQAVNRIRVGKPVVSKTDGSLKRATITRRSDVPISGFVKSANALA